MPMGRPWKPPLRRLRLLPLPLASSSDDESPKMSIVEASPPLAAPLNLSLCRNTRQHASYLQCATVVLRLQILSLRLSSSRSARMASYTSSEQKRATAPLMISSSDMLPAVGMAFTAR